MVLQAVLGEIVLAAVLTSVVALVKVDAVNMVLQNILPLTDLARQISQGLNCLNSSLICGFQLSIIFAKLSLIF